jgi:hypothetical protein
VPGVLAAAAAELSASLSALGSSARHGSGGGALEDDEQDEGAGALLTPWAVGSFATDDTSTNLSDLSAVIHKTIFVRSIV